MGSGEGRGSRPVRALPCSAAAPARRPPMSRLALAASLLAVAVLAGGAAGAPVSGNAAADTSPPSVPQGQAFSGTTRTTVTLVWRAATDDVGVAGYRLFRNGARVAETTRLSYTYTGLRCGTAYTFALEAFDAAGNVSNRAEATGRTNTLPCAASTAPPPAPIPGRGGAANLWVDVDGGACLRRTTRGPYRDAAACSWRQAYLRAASGDLILVRGGGYGDVKLGPGRAGVRRLTFRTAPGARVVVRDFENGHVAGVAGASGVAFVGPARARTFRVDRASGVLVDRWLVDCGGCVGEQVFHVEDAVNVVLRNSEVRNNTDNSLMWVSGRNLVFERNVIHDAGLRPGSGAHTECMYAWNVTNLTLKRNHFYRCAVMDVFITGSAVANGGLVENNVFEKPWETTGVISNSAYAFHFRTGGNPSPDPSNWTFRHNTFVGPLSINTTENPVGPGGMTVTGNVFLAGAPCGHTNTTYNNNAFVSGGCGAARLTRPLATYLRGFRAGYRLTAASVLRDRGKPGDAPLRDRDGRLRVGRADLGAHEYVP